METNRPPPQLQFITKILEYTEWLNVHPKGTSEYSVIFEDSDTFLTMVANGNFCF